MSRYEVRYRYDDHARMRRFEFEARDQLESERIASAFVASCKQGEGTVILTNNNGQDMIDYCPSRAS